MSSYKYTSQLFSCRTYVCMQHITSPWYNYSISLAKHYTLELVLKAIQVSITIGKSIGFKSYSSLSTTYAYSTYMQIAPL